MKKYLNILIPIVICFLVGFTASYFQADSIQSWYPYLNKSSLTPPNYVFPIAWSIIYICMGTSIGLILYSKSLRKKSLILYFGIQLFFNFTWSITFFYLRNPLLGLINIIILDIFVLFYTYKCLSVKRASAVLFIPYILWLILATHLNAYILMHN